MSILRRGMCSITRKPVKSLLLLLIVVVISSFFMAGLASRSASVNVQDSTRQAVGATFRLELNEANRHTRLEEASKIIGAEGDYEGVHNYRLENGAYGVSTDNSFEIIYVFLTIFLYLLKCPQSLILSALRAFCFCGKPHISRSIFLYFLYQSWLKSW